MKDYHKRESDQSSTSEEEELTETVADLVSDSTSLVAPINVQTSMTPKRVTLNKSKLT